MKLYKQAGTIYKLIYNESMFIFEAKINVCINLGVFGSIGCLDALWVT
jgi:hypothetical protein